METTDIEAKPGRWAAARAAAFQDQSVVDRYHLRPPYPQAVIDMLLELAADTPRAVIDVGTGTGELARRLVQSVDRVDAVDLSPAMLARARALPGGDHPRIRWRLGAIEHLPLDPPYALIVGGSSLHWLDWPVAFPRFASLLSAHGVVAIVHRSVAPTPWRDNLRSLLARVAPERDQERPNLVAELERRGLFHEIGRREVGPVPFEQSVADYVESYHSRSSMSLDRIAPTEAAAFDRQLHALVQPWSRDGVLQLETIGSVVWGKPLPIDASTPA
jgi:SAM-dependent methyltransferase